MYLIYCHGRSGSTQLLRAIRNRADHSDSVYDEPFKQRNADRLGYNASIRANIGHYIAWLNASYIKHLFSDLPAELNRKVVSHEAFKGILFLYRRNIVEYAVSMVTARATNEWHGASARSTTRLSTDELKETAEHIVRAIPAQARLVRNNTPTPVTCVAYEDLYAINGISAQWNAATSAFNALGIKETTFISNCINGPLSPTKKYKDERYYRSIFENYDEAISSLSHFSDFFQHNPQAQPEMIFQSKPLQLAD